MNIGFLGPGDPSDVRSYSGVPFFAFAALKRRKSNIISIDVGDLSWSQLTLRLNRMTERLAGQKILASEPAFRLRKSARQADKQIEAANLDALVCLNVDFLIPYLRRKVPIVHNSDTTFAAISNYYDSYKSLGRFARWRANSIAQKALERSAYQSFPSEWALNSGINSYGVDPSKARVIPYGANLGIPPDRKDAIRRKTNGPIRFLFIGGDWQRKGGPVAYQTMLALIEQGVDASMTIVGANPEITHPKLRKLGFLNKQKPHDLKLYNQLWREASFLLMPTQQETFGAVYSEAAANGLPVIACNTGGVGSCVIDGVTGRLLDPACMPKDFAGTILEIWNNAEAYETMSEAARVRYETVLNWDVWAEQILDLAKAATGD